MAAGAADLGSNYRPDSRLNQSEFAQPPYSPARSDRPMARSQKRNFYKALVLYYLAHAQAD